MKPLALTRCLAALSLALAAPAAPAADVTVSAAASLTNAFREIGSAFEAGRPGTSVVFNFGASDALMAQIDKGAPVDVFASADPQAMDRADARKLLESGSRRNFAANTLVLIVPRGSTLAVQAAADLRRAEVRRVAVGNPASAPAGRYARAALEAARLWEAVGPKAIHAQTVRQALDYVARGEVDAGFVYASDAAVMKDKVRVVATVPTPIPIYYPIAAIAGGPNPLAARAFVEFVTASAAQAILARHGFGALP